MRLLASMPRILTASSDWTFTLHLHMHNSQQDACGVQCAAGQANTRLPSILEVGRVLPC